MCALIGVKRLADPALMVEIECMAVITAASRSANRQREIDSDLLVESTQQIGEKKNSKIRLFA